MGGCALLAALLLVGASCSHTPSPEDLKRAEHQRDLGVDSLRAGDYRRALDELLTSNKLEPDNPDTHYALGLVYFTGFGRTREAMEHLKKAAALRENFSDADNALGNVYLAMDDCPRAVPLFRKALDNLVWPTPYLAEQNLGWCLYKMGQTDKGIARLKNAVNTHPQLCGGYDYLARIYSETGKEAESAVWLEKYLKHCDTDALRKFLAPGQLGGVYYRLGMARVRSDNREGAREAFATCLERFAEEEIAPQCRQSLSLLD